MPSVVEPAVTELQIPPGMLRPEAMTSDVPCFAVPHADGTVLVDTGPPGNAGGDQRREAALEQSSNSRHGSITRNATPCSALGKAHLGWVGIAAAFLCSSRWRI
jgi:hypothetical protein